MSIASGFKKMKNYILTSEGYKWISRLTSSQTVVMGDGTNIKDTVESRISALKGITSTLTSSSNEYALSASAGKKLQDQYTELNQSLTNKIGEKTISIGGINIKNYDNTTQVYYSDSISFSLPTNAVPISASFIGAFTAGLLVTQLNDNNLRISAHINITTPVDRKIKIIYYIK